MNTAVEWIEETIGKNNMGNFLKDVLQKAKEMEKEQIMDAWLEGNSTECDADGFAQRMEMEQYYNETFKS